MKTQVTVHEEQKSNVINWDVPQLVIDKHNQIVQTSGKHGNDSFEGIVLDSGKLIEAPFEICEDWSKSLFTTFYGSITLTNINE